MTTEAVPAPSAGAESPRLSRRVEINTEWCKGCGICVAFCPKHALSLDQQGKALWSDPEACVRCGLCELRCPDVAIELVEGDGPCPSE